MSVIASERSVVSAIQAGAQGYVPRDGSDEGVARAIGEVLGGHHPISPALARYRFRLARGLTYVEVGRDLGISTSTVQAHIRNLYRKLGAHSRIQALNRARECGLIG